MSLATQVFQRPDRRNRPSGCRLQMLTAGCRSEEEEGVWTGQRVGGYKLDAGFVSDLLGSVEEAVERSAAHAALPRVAATP